MAPTDVAVQLVVPTFDRVVGTDRVGIHVPHADGETTTQPGILVVGEQRCQCRFLLNERTAFQGDESGSHCHDREEGQSHQLANKPAMQLYF